MSSGPDGEGGFTLIEALIAVVLVGIGVVSVLGSLQVGITSSLLQHNLSKGELTFRNFAEHLLEREYQPCAVPADYAAAFDPPDGLDATVVAVQAWDQTLSSARPFTELDDCEHPEDDPGVQLVRLQVEIQDDPPRTLVGELVKREATG